MGKLQTKKEREANKQAKKILIALHTGDSYLLREETFTEQQLISELTLIKEVKSRPNFC